MTNDTNMTMSYKFSKELLESHEGKRLRTCRKFPLRMSEEERAILRVTAEVGGYSKTGLLLSLLYERFEMLSRENPWMLDAVDSILSIETNTYKPDNDGDY